MWFLIVVHPIRVHTISLPIQYLSRQSEATMTECKPNSELLNAIQGADSKDLKDVTPVENPAAKHDMAMVRR